MEKFDFNGLVDTFSINCDPKNRKIRMAFFNCPNEIIAVQSDENMVTTTFEAKINIPDLTEKTLDELEKLSIEELEKLPIDELLFYSRKYQSTEQFDDSNEIKKSYMRLDGGNHMTMTNFTTKKFKKENHFIKKYGYFDDNIKKLMEEYNNQLLNDTYIDYIYNFLHKTYNIIKIKKNKDWDIIKNYIKIYNYPNDMESSYQKTLREYYEKNPFGVIEKIQHSEWNEEKDSFEYLDQYYYKLKDEIYNFTKNYKHYENDLIPDNDYMVLSLSKIDNNNKLVKVNINADFISKMFSKEINIDNVDDECKKMNKIMINRLLKNGFEIELDGFIYQSNFVTNDEFLNMLNID